MKKGYEKRILLLILLCTCALSGIQQPNINIKNVDDKSLHTLYRMSYQGENLYIHQEKLVNPDGKQVNLKKLFKKHNIGLGWPKNQWNKKETWRKTYSMFIERAEEEKTPYMTSPDELPKLLLDAKTIMKHFLITDDNDLPVICDNYFKKSGINRLFTYAKLKQVIEEKNLTHVKLPKKILVIQDKKTKNYISSKKSPEIIDDILQFSINPGANININYDDTKYNLIIFAQKKWNAGSFNVAARKELSMLCEEAPFDVGYYNIFSDKKGNAVIIDTEFKGEPAEHACPKLNHYMKSNYYEKRI